MCTRSRSCLLALVLVALPARMAFGETLEDVMKKLKDKVGAYKSLQYKSEMKTDMSGEGYTMKQTTTTVGECMKKDGKILARIESKTVGVTKAGDYESKLDSDSLLVSDGAYHYTYMVDANGKKATKTNATSETMPDPFDPTIALKGMEQIHKLKLLPDEKVDGKDAYAIEATPKDEAMRAHMGRSVLYYDKSTGVMMKMTMYDAKGKVSGSSITKDVKIDEKIDESRFVFKTPAGVELQDETKAKKAS